MVTRMLALGVIRTTDGLDLQLVSIGPRGAIMFCFHGGRDVLDTIYTTVSIGPSHLTTSMPPR